MRRIAVVVVLQAIAVTWLSGQGAAQPAKTDMRGTITKSNPASEELKKKGTLGTILVEGPKALNPNSDKASIRITDKTKLEKLVGKDRQAATFEDLKVGVKVQATFAGPIAESYPVQGTAGAVLIVPDFK